MEDPHGSGTSPVVIVIASDQVGSGSEELGRVLTRSFIKTIKEAQPRPWRLVFLNAGIHLGLDESPVLEDLHSMERSGVDLLFCGTCLDYFHKKEHLRVGRVSNMGEIVECLMSAGRVVRV